MNTQALERIKELLKKNNYSKQDLAKKIGVNESTVYSWFLATKNRKEIRMKNLIKIAKLFNVSVSFLQSGNEDSSVKTNLEKIFYPMINQYKDELDFDELPMDSPLNSVLRRFNTETEYLKKVSFYDEGMSDLFYEGDYLLIDCRPLKDIKKAGYYLIATTMDVCIRYISKDIITGQFYLKSYNAQQQTEVLSEKAFHEMITCVYRILGVQRIF